MTQRTWPPTSHRAPCCSRYFHIFDKIDSFPKQFLNLFSIKKANCIFEGLSTVYLIDLLISFFPLLLWITAENRTKLKKLFEIIYLNYKIKGNTTPQTNKLHLIIHSNCKNASDILDWTWFLHYFWLQDSFNNKLKNVWTSKIFLNPANTQSSSEESLTEKRKTFIGTYSLS